MNHNIIAQIPHSSTSFLYSHIGLNIFITLTRRKNKLFRSEVRSLALPPNVFLKTPTPVNERRNNSIFSLGNTPPKKYLNLNLPLHHLKHCFLFSISNIIISINSFCTIEITHSLILTIITRS